MRVIQTGNGHISPASSHPIKKLELQIVSNFLGSVVPQYVVLFVGIGVFKGSNVEHPT